MNLCRAVVAGACLALASLSAAGHARAEGPTGPGSVAPAGSIAEGETTRAPVDPPKTLGPILLMAGGFGLGGLSLVAGAVTGGVAVSKTRDLNERCGDYCSRSLQDDVDEAYAWATAADVSFIAGGALVLAGAGGLIWYALATRGSSTRAGLSVGVSPTCARLRWDF